MEDDFVLVVAKTILALLVGYYYLFYLRKKPSTIDGALRRPPKAAVGMWETIRAVEGDEAPFFMLKLARSLPNDPVFQVPIPLPGGVYAVANSKLQRQVMLDKRADKPDALYGKFIAPGNPRSIFTRSTFDPRWKSTRKCAAPAFSKNQVGRMNSVCNEFVEKWIENRLEGKFIAKNESFDPSEEMTQLTYFTIMKAGFEYDVTEEEYRRYVNNVHGFLREFGLRQVANPLRRPFGWFLAGYRNAIRGVHENFGFLQNILDTYRKLPVEQRSPDNTLIKLLTKNTDDATEDIQIVAEMGTFVAGGFETTGFTLSTTLVLLAMHPDIQSKVRRAQFELPKEERTKVTSEYLKCVLKESRRFLPVVAMGASRQLPVAFKLGDYEIPAGAMLLLPQMLSHRDANIFAPDPDVFRPERWLDPSSEMNESLISFATGARNCVGQSLAVAELDSVLPLLLTNYEFTIDEPGGFKYFLTLKIMGAKLKANRVHEVN